MATVTFTNAEIDFLLALGGSNTQFAAVAAAWVPNGMEGDSGVVAMTNWSGSVGGGQLLSVIGVPHDDGVTVPPVITMTDAFVEFDWAVTNGASAAGGTTSSQVDCAGTAFDTQAQGSFSGSFSEHNDPTTYFGGTDRATLFSAGMALQYFGFWTAAFGNQNRRIAWSNYTITITYDTPTTPAVTSVTPASGSVSGGQHVTIRGTGLLSGSGVEFGGIAAASFVIVNDTTVTAVTPSHLTGVVDVEVLGAAVGDDLYTFVVETLRLPQMPVNTPIFQGGGTKGRR